MARRMLIDATHTEETRVTVVNGNRLEEFDYEVESRRQLKGNIYLAKVTRVEPSLQACFVDYGGNRHGFLAFSEIHPDYYRIPVSDRDDLVDEEQGDDEEEDVTENNTSDETSVEEVGGDEGSDEAQEQTARKRPRLKRQYKIQEVIKRRQVILVQVVKEERGNKGAALTTYLSLAGRYCVLMPNTSRGGGVSRKITNISDRKRLKSVVSELQVPKGMAVIVRTAGAGRTKTEVKRDFEYIVRLWDQIRTNTLEATAPSLIHEEGNLIKRSIRDLYTKEIEEVLVAGDSSYRTAKDFMKMLMPSHAKKVQPYRDDTGIPLFQRYQVESQLSAIHAPTVNLKSGGSIVMNQTEALVAIDVNSGRATRERHIEETALKTNLEAAEEIARQLRLRDMAGLIVIDFIDMDDHKNDAAVERKLKEALRRDRARIQVGRISPFGLLEMSRQRLRPSLLEAISQHCPTCAGTGYIQSTESAALNVLRTIEEEGLRRRTAILNVTVNPEVAMYILNSKRNALSEMERNYGYRVSIIVDTKMLSTDFRLEREGELDGEALIKDIEPIAPEPEQEQETDKEQGEGKSRRRRRRRRGKKRDDERDDANFEENTNEESASEEEDSLDADNDGEDSQGRKRRKRGRRGGRRRHKGKFDGDEFGEASENADSDDEERDEADQNQNDQSEQSSGDDRDTQENGEQRQKRGRGRRGNRHPANRRGRRDRDDKGPNSNNQDNLEQAADAGLSNGETAVSDVSSSDQPSVAAEAPATSESVTQGVIAEDDKPRKVRRRKIPIESVDGVPTSEVAEASKAPAEASAENNADNNVSDDDAKPAKKTRAKKASSKKASAKKTGAKKATAKKASAKKTRAKKASAKTADAKEAVVENAKPASDAQTSPSGSSTSTPSTAPAAPAPAPAASTPTPAPTSSAAPAQSEAPKDDKPKSRRKGWWSRVIGG
ncbi:MAG: ribonuclease E/G [Alphaproteobacteria bacterium]|nr:ribonuclease E/G [Alphaproteobacteria bacterium]